MYRLSVRALTRRAPTGSSTSGRVLAVHNGLEGKVQLVTASELRGLDPKCPVNAPGSSWTLPQNPQK